MTNLASSGGTSSTLSSAKPSSLIASREGGSTRILGWGGIGGSPGLAAVDEEEATLVACRIANRGRYGILEGPATAAAAGNRNEIGERTARRDVLARPDEARDMTRDVQLIIATMI